jgi:hypothetical protein
MRNAFVGRNLQLVTPGVITELTPSTDSSASVKSATSSSMKYCHRAARGREEAGDSHSVHGGHGLLLPFVEDPPPRLGRLSGRSERVVGNY